MTTRSTIVACLTVIFVTGSSGCSGLLQPGGVSGAAYSSQITFVMEHPADFKQSETDSLAKTAPGTIHDDLSQLSGCFGASYQSSFLGLPFDGYEAFHFDPAQMSVTYWILQGPAYIVRTGHYSIAGTDRIVITEEREDGTEHSSTALVTLKDGQLRIAYRSMDGNYLDGASGHADDERVGLVFKSFSCDAK
ncbi:MAG: hypothetical protein HZA51_14155 [Planctomycetes bacterium]|nr:hypothetical protein [Planctomycetota bacterium]